MRRWLKNPAHAYHAKYTTKVIWREHPIVSTISFFLTFFWAASNSSTDVQSEINKTLYSPACSISRLHKTLTCIWEPIKIISIAFYYYLTLYKTATCLMQTTASKFTPKGPGKIWAIFGPFLEVHKMVFFPSPLLMLILKTKNGDVLA